MSKYVIAIAALSASFTIFGTLSDAQSRKYDGKPVGSVTACSKYGNHGCVTAKIRQTQLGLQYRSKGGNWIWCEHDCRDTIRRHTVDFWNDQMERSK